MLEQSASEMEQPTTKASGIDVQYLLVRRDETGLLTGSRNDQALNLDDLLGIKEDDILRNLDLTIMDGDRVLVGSGPKKLDPGFTPPDRGQLPEKFDPGFTLPDQGQIPEKFDPWFVPSADQVDVPFLPPGQPQNPGPASLPDSAALRSVESAPTDSKNFPLETKQSKFDTGLSYLSAATLEEPALVKERKPAIDALNVPETITFENNAKRLVYKDGHIHESRTNGLEIDIKPDHRVTVISDRGVRERVPTYPEREVSNIKVDDDSTVTFTYKDSTVETYYPMGTHTIKHPDKTYEIYSDKGLERRTPTKIEGFDPSGKKISEYEKINNVTIRRDGEGRIDVTMDDQKLMRRFKYDTDENGKDRLTEIKGHQGNWKRMEDENSKSVWVNQTSGKVLHGEFTVNKFGDLTFTPQNPSNAALVLTADGKSITVPRGRRH